MSTFTYRPATARKASRPRVITAPYGDGYEQRQEDGMNPNLAMWDLSFTNLTLAEGDAIELFFKTEGGWTSFDWIVPGELIARKFVAQEWSREFDPQRGGESNIAVMFREVPA